MALQEKARGGYTAEHLGLNGFQLLFGKDFFLLNQVDIWLGETVVPLAQSYLLAMMYEMAKSKGWLLALKSISYSGVDMNTLSFLEA